MLYYQLNASFYGLKFMIKIMVSANCYKIKHILKRMLHSSLIGALPNQMPWKRKDKANQYWTRFTVSFYEAEYRLMHIFNRGTTTRSNWYASRLGSLNAILLIAFPNLFENCSNKQQIGTCNNFNNCMIIYTDLE